MTIADHQHYCESCREKWDCVHVVCKLPDNSECDECENGPDQAWFDLLEKERIITQ